ncbi:MAG: hypothetical protein PHD99_04950 [Candidatus Moranbacteria bacterium]|nr:hypothetical protein [Candidatus Moranbacteria bacterium]
MKTIIHAVAIRDLTSRNPNLAIEVEMTESQAFEALNQFLHFISDDTWVRWQAQINKQVYGIES